MVVLKFHGSLHVAWGSQRERMGNECFGLSLEKHTTSDKLEVHSCPPPLLFTWYPLCILPPFSMLPDFPDLLAKDGKKKHATLQKGFYFASPLPLHTFWNSFVQFLTQ